MKSLYPLQTLAGMSLVLMSPALEAILRTFGVGESGGGLLYFAFFTGGTLGTLSISWLARLFPSRRILQWAACCGAAGMLAFSASSSLKTACVAIFVTGAMTGLLVSYPGALLASRHREQSGGPMSFMYAFFALGVTLYPMLAGYGLSRGVAWQTLFQGMAVLFLAWAVAAAFTSLPDMREAEGLSLGTLREAGRAGPALLVGAILMNTLYIGAETSLVGWVVYYFQKVFSDETSIFRASRVLTYFWTAMILGRISTSMIVKRLGSFRTLTLLLTGAFFLWAGALLAPGLVLAEILFSAAGFFFSGIFPIVVSYSGKFPPRYTGLVFSAILAGGGIGGTIFPFFLGLLAQWKGVQAGMAAVVPAPLLMLAVLFLVRRRGADV